MCHSEIPYYARYHNISLGIGICPKGCRGASQYFTSLKLSANLIRRITRPKLSHFGQCLRRRCGPLFPQFPEPPSPIDFFNHEVPRIREVRRDSLALKNPTVEPCRGHDSAFALRIPRVRRCNVKVAPLLPSSPIVLSDDSTERLVHLQEAVVIVPRVVEGESAVGMKGFVVTGNPVEVVYGLGSRVGVEC